jgi:hypothetical protein
MTTLPPSCFLKYGCLSLLEPLGSLQACNGITLHLTYGKGLFVEGYEHESANFNRNVIRKALGRKMNGVSEGIISCLTFKFLHFLLLT